MIEYLAGVVVLTIIVCALVGLIALFIAYAVRRIG